MSRNCAFPSMAQVEKALECLEEKRYLATGYARIVCSCARDHTRAAWQDVSNGCVKTRQQRAKYWKDKKTALKNKATKIRMARQRCGGGQRDNISLTVIEQKRIGLMGGAAFASGDRYCYTAEPILKKFCTHILYTPGQHKFVRPALLSFVGTG